MKCPKCGNESIRVTCIGFIAIYEPVKDKNHATCDKCGHAGLAWEFGAPDIQPPAMLNE